MESTTLNAEKKKLTMSIIFTMVAIGLIFFIGITLFLGGDFDIKEIKSPITYIFLGVFAFIALAHFVNKFRKFKRLTKLLPAMELVSKQLGMQYLSEETTPTAQSERVFLKPIIGKIKGINLGREVTIYPAFDFTGVKNNQPRMITVFQMHLPHESPDISIETKGVLFKALSKIMVGSIEFMEKYYIVPKFNENNDEQSRIKILEDTKKIFSPEAMLAYSSIPGRKILFVRNNSVVFGMSGFHYNVESYQKGLDFITKVDSSLEKAA